MKTWRAGRCDGEPTARDVARRRSRIGLSMFGAALGMGLLIAGCGNDNVPVFAPNTFSGPFSASPSASASLNGSPSPSSTMSSSPSPRPSSSGSPSPSASPAVVLASAGASGAGDGDTFEAALSADGNIVVMSSSSKNLVAGNTKTTNNFDIFILDRSTGQMQRLMGVNGAEPDGQSGNVGISADSIGQFIVFTSTSDNMVSSPVVTLGTTETYLYDRINNKLTLVSQAGGQAANADAVGTTVSADGTKVPFYSAATNLGQTVSGSSDQVYLATLSNGTPSLTLVSANTLGQPSNNDFGTSGAWISSSGQFVGFDSDATDLVSPGPTATPQSYRRDVQGGTTIQASLTSSGGQPDSDNNLAVLSPDGSLVAFASDASNMLGPGSPVGQMYDRNLSVPTTELLSAANGTNGPAPNNTSGSGAINVFSADNRFAVFDSLATNLAANDTHDGTVNDVFVRDRVSNTTVLADLLADGTQPNSGCGNETISFNGKVVAFFTAASNFPASNGHNQIYLLANPLSH